MSLPVVALDFKPRGAAHGFLLRGVPAAVPTRAVARLLSRFGGLERCAALAQRSDVAADAGSPRAFLVTYLRTEAAAAARAWLHNRVTYSVAF